MFAIAGGVDGDTRDSFHDRVFVKLAIKYKSGDVETITGIEAHDFEETIGEGGSILVGDIFNNDKANIAQDKAGS